MPILLLLTPITVVDMSFRRLPGIGKKEAGFNSSTRNVSVIIPKITNLVAIDLKFGGTSVLHVVRN